MEERKDLEELLVRCEESQNRENCSSLSDSERNPSSPHVKSVKRTIRTLQLDHSQKWWSFSSWVIGFVMILLIPILRVIYVKPADNKSSHKLLFQPVVVTVGILMSSVSFLFLSQSIRKYGIQGILFLDMVSEETAHVREEYNEIIQMLDFSATSQSASFLQHGATKLAKLFIPALILYILQICWFYIEIPLALLPYLNSRTENIVIISVSVGISWMFQTTTFLYACILFWKVCVLQELRMKVFKDTLQQGGDPELYCSKYTAIIKCLQSTSRRFRLFIALSGCITIFSALASMYEVVKDCREVSIWMSGELVVMNLVNLTGIGLCLQSASKIAHLHRRIVKVASSMHAKTTFATSKVHISSRGKDQSLEFQEKMLLFCQVQDAWTQRSALVNFLSNNSAGISVYGFVLDRFFVHTSIASLLTTMWFLLGQSLSS